MQRRIPLLTAISLLVPAIALVVLSGCSDDEALRLANSEIAKGNETIAALNDQVAQQNAQLAAAEAEATGKDETIASLNSEVSEGNATIAAFVESEAEWELEFSELTVAHDALAQQNTDLETGLAALEGEHTTVTGLLAEAQADLADVKAALAEAQANAAALGGAGGRVQTLEERAAAIEARVNALLEQERSLTSEYASLRSAYEAFLKERCSVRSDDAPYYGTVQITPNILRPTDPTALQSVTYIGRGDRLVWDYRPAAWVTINAYLFSVSYGHVELEFQVNPEFGSEQAARAQVDNYAAALGRIPAFLLSRGENVHINDGPGNMGGNWGDRSFTISADRGEEHIRNGTIEEVFVHEGAHVSLDGAHKNSQGWREAQMKDCVSISRYARDNPTLEDVAESILPYFALRYFPERLTDADKAAILNNIPNRIAYFDEQGFDLSTPE